MLGKKSRHPPSASVALPTSQLHIPLAVGFALVKLIYVKLLGVFWRINPEHLYITPGAFIFLLSWYLWPTSFFAINCRRRLSLMSAFLLCLRLSLGWYTRGTLAFGKTFLCFSNNNSCARLRTFCRLVKMKSLGFHASMNPSNPRLIGSALRISWHWPLSIWRWMRFFKCFNWSPFALWPVSISL